jgi:hypothetical protein
MSDRLRMSPVAPRPGERVEMTPLSEGAAGYDLANRIVGRFEGERACLGLRNATYLARGIEHLCQLAADLAEEDCADPGICRECGGSGEGREDADVGLAIPDCAACAGSGASAPCGECLSCRARALVARIDGGRAR